MAKYKMIFGSQEWSTEAPRPPGELPPASIAVCDLIPVSCYLCEGGHQAGRRASVWRAPGSGGRGPGGGAAAATPARAARFPVASCNRHTRISPL